LLKDTGKQDIDSQCRMTATLGISNLVDDLSNQENKSFAMILAPL